MLIATMHKKIILILIASLFVLGIGTQAQNKVIKKTVKKVIKPQIAPITPPEISTEEAPSISAPPPAPTFEIQAVIEDKGIFGWGLNSNVNAGYLYNTPGQRGFLGIIAGRLNLVIDDPLKVGSGIGLAEDALQYNVGLGLAFGNDSNESTFNSIPLFADAVLYLKEGSFLNGDPFIGFGLNMNLYGSGQKSGGVGSQFYYGLLYDMGFPSGKTGLVIGAQSFKIADTHSASGIYFSILQPLVL